MTETPETPEVTALDVETLQRDLVKEQAEFDALGQRLEQAQSIVQSIKEDRLVRAGSLAKLRQQIESLTQGTEVVTSDN